MVKFNNIMLDIETMGTESFSSIVSIGAVKFNIDSGEMGDEFYVNIDLQSCLDLGLIVDSSTVIWWLQQTDQAKKSITNDNKISIQNALIQFSLFCNINDVIWGNSARFDCGILQNAYNKVGISIPWDFRKERCVRTLVSFAPEIKNNTSFIGIKHNALDDCKYQINYVSKIWNYLKK